MNGKRVYLTLTDIALIFEALGVLQLYYPDRYADVEKEADNLEKKLFKARMTIEEYNQ